MESAAPKKPRKTIAPKYLPLKIWNKRMLLLLDEYISRQIGHDIDADKTRKRWCENIGFNASNLKAVIAGKRSFSNDRILKAAKKSGVTTDWILGATDVRLIKPADQYTALQLIEEGLKMLKNSSF